MIPKRQTDDPKPSAPGDLIGLSASLRLATLAEGEIDDPHQAVPLTFGKEELPDIRSAIYHGARGRLKVARQSPRVNGDTYSAYPAILSMALELLAVARSECQYF